MNEKIKKEGKEERKTGQLVKSDGRNGRAYVNGGEGPK
jgi:hypothetical protein